MNIYFRLFIATFCLLIISGCNEVPTDSTPPDGSIPISSQELTGVLQTSEPKNDLNEQSEQFIEYARSLEYYMDHQLIEVPDGKDLTSKDELEFELDGQIYRYRRTTEQQGENFWKGRSTTTNGTVDFKIYDDGRIAGATVWESEFTFFIFALAPEDGLHILVQVDREKFPPDGDDYLIPDVDSS